MKGYIVPDLSQNLVHFANLLLVWKIYGCIEVWNILHGGSTHQLIFTGMGELSTLCQETRNNHVVKQK